MAQTPHPSRLIELRDTIARLERGPVAPDAPPPLPFGIPPIDAALPGGGLKLGAVHEVACTGAQAGYGAAAALFAAGILARIPGPVLWALERRDLFAPGLAGAGLHPDRVIYAEAGRDQVLLVMEEALRHRGLGGVVAETSGRITLGASRRLQLAAEATGVIGLLLRRPLRTEAELARDGRRWNHRRPKSLAQIKLDGSTREREQTHPAIAGAVAAVTRWRIGALPSAPPIPGAPDVPGLGRMRWRLELIRCRGGRTGTWIVEACDASGHLGLVAALADGSAETDARQLGAAA